MKNYNIIRWHVPAVCEIKYFSLPATLR